MQRSVLIFWGWFGFFFCVPYRLAASSGAMPLAVTGVSVDWSGDIEVGMVLTHVDDEPVEVLDAHLVRQLIRMAAKDLPQRTRSSTDLAVTRSASAPALERAVSQVSLRGWISEGNSLSTARLDRSKTTSLFTEDLLRNRLTR